MHRLHLLEIEDLPWCPPALRNSTTDFLQCAMARLDPYAPVRPLLIEALQRTGARVIVDLCSGGGGPWRQFYNAMQEPLAHQPRLWLTDLYPNQEGGIELQRQHPRHVAWWPESVDATRPPEELTGFYTLFTSAHHFRPEALRQILRHAVDRRQGIAMFELTHRSPRALLLALLVPLAVMLLAPWCRPFRRSRLIWTYLIPLAPLLALFDGLVSCLRSYRPDELRQIVNDLGDTGYRWQIGELPSELTPIPLTYLIGTPRNR